MDHEEAADEQEQLEADKVCHHVPLGCDQDANGLGLRCRTQTWAPSMGI
jgi:hypothetical protein